MKLSDLMKIYTLAYWKYLKRHPVGAIECKNADVLTMSRSYMLTESEIKTSIFDMERETSTKRYKHWVMSKGKGVPSLYPLAHYFYFVLPRELQNKAIIVIKNKYPYAGLMIFENKSLDLFKPKNIEMIKRAKRLDRPKVELQELREIAYGSTNTIMRSIDQYYLKEKK